MESDKGERLGLPDRRKNTYEALETQLNGHISAIENRFRKWFVRGLIGFCLIGTTSAVALFGFGYALRAVQEQRYDNCRSTNIRHDATYDQLVQAARVDQNNAKDEAAREEIRRRRDVTLGLIDAIAPKQDCTKIKKAIWIP